MGAPFDYKFVQILDLGRDGRPEIVLAPSELATQRAVLVLGWREGVFRCQADLPLGSVGAISLTRYQGAEAAVLTVDRAAGARSWGLGSLEQEGHALLAGGEAGPEFAARWVYPGQVSDRTRRTYRNLSGWI
ncbi:MAG: hypothetical protein JKY65_06650 [Planctomycetes bacterium]|nr:hypothetical protein [Planctomycetota bacterium]